MKRILVIGAASAIAEQYSRIEAAVGSSFFLVGRSERKLAAIAADLRVRGGGTVEIHIMDVNDFEAHTTLLDLAWKSLGAVDVALIAHGTLPDQVACQTDVGLALHEFSTNAVASIALMTALAARMETQSSGTIAVISSVAGDRGRASNYLYGSAKSAISTFASGLRQRLRTIPLNVLTIKPGFIDTPMTSSFSKGPLWSKPDKAAKDISHAINSGRSVVYVPGFWWAIMRIITHIPEPLFRRLGL